MTKRIAQTLPLISDLAVTYYAGWNQHVRTVLPAGTVVEVELTSGLWPVRVGGRKYTANPQAVMWAVGQI